MRLGKGVGLAARVHAARWKGDSMSLHDRLSMPRLSVSKNFLVDLEAAGAIALVPLVLCVLLFAAELFR